MTITVEIYEDTGAVTSSHGTLRQSVSNIGWKNNANDETNSYVFYPLQRPTSGVTRSYKKYNYMKISGTFPRGSRPRIEVSGSTVGAPPVGYQATDGNKLYYKLTNTYAVPDNAADGTLTEYLNTTVTLYPNVSTTGPEAATTTSQYLTGSTTYYTEYLVTQLHVEPGLDTEYGNIGELAIKVFIDEYESTDT